METLTRSRVLDRGPSRMFEDGLGHKIKIMFFEKWYRFDFGLKPRISRISAWEAQRRKGAIEPLIVADAR